MTPEQLLAWFSSTPHRVTCITWNNDGTNLAVGLTRGFIIYSAELLLGDDGWLREVCRRPVDGGVSVIALHAQTNLVVTAGWAHGHRSTVIIHNLANAACEDGEHSIIAQVTLSSIVNGICFHPYLVAVSVDSNVVHLFDRALQTIKSFEITNPVKGSRDANVMAMASILDSQTASGVVYSILRLVILGKDIGSVRCVRYACEQNVEAFLEKVLGGVPRTIAEPLRVKHVELHRNAVRVITITPDGSFALTVSERGTALKLLDVEKGVTLCQFSRGTTPNVVHALALFVSATDIIATCVTDTGTLHLFHLSPVAMEKHAASKEAEEPTKAAADFSVVRRWTDYCKSVNPKARLAIPEDTLYDRQCGSGGFNKSSYALAFRPLAKKDSCLANLVQWDTSPNGVSRARLLCVQIDSITAKKTDMNVVRSFYFPKDEL